MRTRCFLLSVGLSFFICFAAGAQVIPEGTYIGYERIDVARMQDGNLYFYPGVATSKIRAIKDAAWFHQVTLTIKKDSAFLSKVPIVLDGERLSYSDSSGGFYTYNGAYRKMPDSSMGLIVYLLTRRNIGHSSHGNPFYMMYLYKNLRLKEKGFIADAGNLKDVRYVKIN